MESDKPGQCVHQVDDYLECLHGKKEVILYIKKIIIIFFNKLHL